jgi:hypothetical protein
MLHSFLRDVAYIQYKAVSQSQILMRETWSNVADAGAKKIAQLWPLKSGPTTVFDFADCRRGRRKRV